MITSVYEESYRSSDRTMPVLKSCYKERADMNPMSKEVKQGRWKMIGHTLKQDQNSDCNIAVTWAPEGKRRSARPKTTWRQTVEKEKGEAG